MTQARLTWQPLTLQLRNPFGLSYGVTQERRVFWLRLAGDEGWGEAAVPPYYGVAEADMFVAWERAARAAAPLPDDPTSVTAWIEAAGAGDGPAAARCALDLALHDRIARLRGVALHRLYPELPPPRPLATCQTVAIAEPAEMARLARDAAGFGVLKVKLGSDDDIARLAAVAAARPDARLRVDANAGWTPDEAVRRLAALERFHIELVEQPVAAHDIAGMGYVQARTRLPVIADESAQTLADVEALARAGVQGINLKLQKAGGLAPALAMLRRARALGLRVMLGCMIETSLGVTAMAHLAGLADWLDLDGPLLIANDPFAGVTFDAAGRVSVPDRPGIGVVRRPTSSE